MGGLSKKAWQFGQVLENARQPSLKLDGGGLLFNSLRLDDFKLPQLEITAAGIVQAYNGMGYDAVGVGGADLAAGLGFLRRMSKSSNFAWLSANLVNLSDGRPLFTPFISRDIAGTRVAIAGLTGTGVPDEILTAGKAGLRPWGAVLPGLLSEILPEHDFIILLTDYPMQQCAEIARRYPAINLIIAAGGQSENMAPRLISPTTMLVSTGKQGKYIGVLQVGGSIGRAWQEADDVAAELGKKNAALRRVCGQIEALQGRRGVASRLGNLQRKKTVLLADIAELDNKRGKAEISYYSNRFYTLDSGVGDEAKVATIVEAIKTRINETAGQAAVADVRPPGFAGQPACAACHVEQVRIWRRSAHAQAFATLIEKKQQFNYNCVPCHVTGIDAGNISQSLALAAEFHDVGCEACHGPARAHVQAADHPAPAPVTADICLRCHVPEHDDGFDFAADINKLGCGR